MGHAFAALGIARELRDFTAGLAEHLLVWLHFAPCISQSMCRLTHRCRSFTSLCVISKAQASIFTISMGTQHTLVLASYDACIAVCRSSSTLIAIEVGVSTQSYRPTLYPTATPCPSFWPSGFRAVMGVGALVGALFVRLQDARCQACNMAFQLHATNDEGADETATSSINEKLGAPLCVDHLVELDRLGTSDAPQAPQHQRSSGCTIVLNYSQHSMWQLSHTSMPTAWQICIPHQASGRRASRCTKLRHAAILCYIPAQNPSHATEASA